MGDIKHRNKIRIATTTQEREEDAINDLYSRELLYNRDNKTLGIIIEDKEGNKYRQIVSGLVDEVNITKNENYETKLKEDVIIDSITTQADHNGIDWKSQSKFAETSTERTIILLFKQDTTQANGIGVIGGDVLEKGDAVYGHYQVSMTSTGSRLVKGSTTNAKKARPCLAKLNGVYYYGLHFRNSSPAGIYFAGWSKIPDGLAAPSYTTYTDGDLSEIIDLDDDSDTGTQVVNYEFLTYDDITWEFFDAPFSTTTKSYTASNLGNYSQQSLQVRDTSGNLIRTISDTFYTLETNRCWLWRRNNDNRTVNGEIYFRGGSGPMLIFGVNEDQGTLKITMRMLSNASNGGYRSIQLFNAYEYDTGEALATYAVPAYANTEITIPNLPMGGYVIRTGGSCYIASINYEGVTSTDENENAWKQGGNNKGYSMTNGLRVTTDVNTSWYEGTSGGNAGYIDIESAAGISNPAMTLRMLSKCTVTVGFLSRTVNNSNIRLSETLDTSDSLWSKSVSVDNSSTSNIVECSYEYTGSESKDLYILCETNPIRISYVKIDYPDSGDNSNDIADIVRGLPDTGEDGSPHIIRFSGEISRIMLLKLAATLREDSNKQVVIDCSEGYMEASYLDWRSDTEKTNVVYNGITYSMCLNSCFSNCISLREFYYPHNVTSTGSDTFRNCSFLRKVRLNDEITTIGDNQSQWSANNNSLFAGSRLKTIYIPKNVASFSGYCFSFSNIRNVYFEEGSAFITAATNTYGNWASFPSVKEQLRFKCPADLYAVWSKMNGTWNSYGNGGMGADGDGVQFIGSNCIWSDHVELWEGSEEDINYTE